MKNYITTLTIAITIIMSSCSDIDIVPDLTLTDCPPSIDLGSFELTDESLEFFTYSDRDTVRFIDQDNIDHILVPTYFNELYDSQVIVETLCEKDLVARQIEFYHTQRSTIRLEDKSNGGYIWMDLSTILTNSDGQDASMIYDNFSLQCATQNSAGISTRIISSIQKELEHGTDPNEVKDLATYIGKTTINNKIYKDVYRGDFQGVGSIFYNKEYGIIQIYVSENDYLVLKN